MFKTITSPRAVALRESSAFTLVELLVVIGIIAVLIGILLPVLSKVRKQANQAATLSNLRQIGLSIANYEVQFKGHYPTNLGDGNQDGRAFGGLALLCGMYKLPPKVLINPNTTDTPATAFNALGWPVVAEIGGVEVTTTSPATIDSSNIGNVTWHCSFSYDHERKRSGSKKRDRVYLGDRGDYARGRSFSGNWEGKGMCLLWTDQHAEFVTSKAVSEQQDPNVYHHNQYVDDSGNHPREGGDESVDGVSVTPNTLDTHLRFFSEEEDDGLLRNP